MKISDYMKGVCLLTDMEMTTYIESLISVSELENSNSYFTEYSNEYSSNSDMISAIEFIQKELVKYIDMTTTKIREHIHETQNDIDNTRKILQSDLPERYAELRVPDMKKYASKNESLIAYCLSMLHTVISDYCSMIVNDRKIDEYLDTFARKVNSMTKELNDIKNTNKPQKTEVVFDFVNSTTKEFMNDKIIQNVSKEYKNSGNRIKNSLERRRQEPYDLDIQLTRKLALFLKTIATTIKEQRSKFILISVNVSSSIIDKISKFKSE